MRNEMHKTTRSRHKHGEGAPNTRTGDRRGYGERRHAIMIDCYEHEYKTQPLSMIECTICEHSAYSAVEYVESEALINGGFVSRPCHHCGITTTWKLFDLPASANMGWSTSN